MAIKTTSTKESRIQDIHTVGSSKDGNAIARFEAIHFDKDLIECLFSFIIGSAEFLVIRIIVIILTYTFTAFFTDRINLIDKYNTRSILSCLGK